MSDSTTSPAPQKRALLFEDNPTIGERIFQLLQSWGFAVLWIVKINELQEHGIDCTCSDTTPPHRHAFIVYGHEPIDVVILDGVLGPTGAQRHGPQGWDIAPNIWRLAKACVLIGSDEFHNDSMSRLLGETVTRFSTSHKQCQPDLFEADLQKALIQFNLLQEAGIRS